MGSGSGWGAHLGAEGLAQRLVDVVLEHVERHVRDEAVLHEQAEEPRHRAQRLVRVDREAAALVEEEVHDARGDLVRVRGRAWDWG